MKDRAAKRKIIVHFKIKTDQIITRQTVHNFIGKS